MLAALARVVFGGLSVAATFEVPDAFLAASAITLAGRAFEAVSFLAGDVFGAFAATLTSLTAATFADFGAGVVLVGLETAFVCFFAAGLATGAAVADGFFAGAAAFSGVFAAFVSAFGSFATGFGALVFADRSDSYQKAKNFARHSFATQARTTK